MTQDMQPVTTGYISKTPSMQVNFRFLVDSSFANMHPELQKTSKKALCIFLIVIAALFGGFGLLAIFCPINKAIEQEKNSVTVTINTLQRAIDADTLTEVQKTPEFIKMKESLRLEDFNAWKDQNGALITSLPKLRINREGFLKDMFPLLTGLTELSVTSDVLIELEDEIQRTQIETLSISGGYLRQIPTFVYKMQRLTHLTVANIRGNFDTPKAQVEGVGLMNLTNLTHLTLKNIPGTGMLHKDVLEHRSLTHLTLENIGLLRIGDISAPNMERVHIKRMKELSRTTITCPRGCSIYDNEVKRT